MQLKGTNKLSPNQQVVVIGESYCIVMLLPTSRIAKFLFLSVTGDRESGKTTLVAKLQGNVDPKKGSGLEYAYIDVRDEYRDGNLTCFSSAWLIFKEFLLSERSHPFGCLAAGRRLEPRSPAPLCIDRRNLFFHSSDANSVDDDTVGYARPITRMGIPIARPHRQAPLLGRSHQGIPAQM